MDENYLHKESLLNKKRKLDKGKEEESYSDVIKKSHIHKSPSSILSRKRLSDSNFNFNISSSDALYQSLDSNWELPENKNDATFSQSNLNFISNEEINEIGSTKITINEPPDIPIIEEFDEQNEPFSFFNSKTLQYEYTTEGIVNNNNVSNKYNYNIIPAYSNTTSNKHEFHRQESSLVPFKQGSQVILYNNNNTGQIVLYNKANKSLSIHKVRQLSKEIISRNKRCILCNQLLPPERENINNNIFKDSHTYTDTNYFKLLARSLTYNKNPTLTDISNSDNEIDSSPIHSVNSAENIINLLNDNSNTNYEHIYTNPTITIINSSKEGSKNEDEGGNLEEKNITNNENNNRNNEVTDSEGATTYLSDSSFNNGYYERFFIERKKLGRGYRGSVFLCHHVLDQVFLGEYAIKKVAVGNNHQWLVRMLKEVMLLEKLRNQNIIEYKHAWLEEHKFSTFGPKVPCLFILMERANGGNLEEYIQLQWNPDEKLENALSVKEKIKRKRLQMKAAQNQARDNRAQYFGGIGYDFLGKRVRYLTTEAIWKIFLDICYGLNHLHELGIIHRDLKPPNLLLQYKDPNNQEEIPKVLISDFGECEILSHLEKRQRTGATGTLEFMAELLISDENGHYYDDYSSNSDLWSLGVVLYYICFSEMPYSQVDDIDILKNEILNLTTVHFKNDNNSNRVPKELKSLIKKLMVKEPTKRPKAREILNLYGGYKDGTGIKISSSVDNLSKFSLNSNSASTSTKNLNEMDSVSIKKENNKNNNNYDSNYLTPLQNTKISKSKIKKNENETYIINRNEKGKGKDNDNENENENIYKENEDDKIKIEIKEKLEKDVIIENKKNNKEIIDEPLSFHAEKRIVPFNHNRSKSLPQQFNNQIYATYKNKQQSNNIIKEGNETFDILETHKSEKSLVQYRKFEHPERLLPTQTYPPIKHNDKEYSSSRSTNLIEKHQKKEKWINENDYTKEIIKKKSREIINDRKRKKKFIGKYLYIYIFFFLQIK
ncbi:kinase-like protein [Piromyces finnis]|uniref:non-specific serine/threonine protein kinase n=1 Tax=Piromyces finnis TaxID=1754191 RepID=A0A1Y1VFV4_9FUNG|nr:kinase-like protein [Piromyces finnis]|eukprot:ORX55229.1 kinase-like protein [Piromyces finnis]